MPRTADDTYGHGTAVAGWWPGTGGTATSGDPLYGQYAGTAPDANLISIKIADDSGARDDPRRDLRAAVRGRPQGRLQHPRRQPFVPLHVGQSYTTDPLDAAVEQAWFHGITVVAAAGNLGIGAGRGLIRARQRSVRDHRRARPTPRERHPTSDDVQAGWSSRGVTQDGFPKPDVLAPGAHIVSTLAPGSSFATACPTCVIGGAYFQLSGTSLAAPIVAGIAADLLAVHPGWTPAMVKGAIVNTAVPLADGGARGAGDGGVLGQRQPARIRPGLTPNDLIDTDTNSIDYDAASWSAASWSTAPIRSRPAGAPRAGAALDCSSDRRRRRQPDRRELEQSSAGRQPGGRHERDRQHHRGRSRIQVALAARASVVRSRPLPDVLRAGGDLGAERRDDRRRRRSCSEPAPAPCRRSSPRSTCRSGRS